MLLDLGRPSLGGRPIRGILLGTGAGEGVDDEGLTVSNDRKTELDVLTLL
jgi:hypothetical protein